MASSKSLLHSGYNIVLEVKVEQLFLNCGASYVSSDECLKQTNIETNRKSSETFI